MKRKLVPGVFIAAAAFIAGLYLVPLPSLNREYSSLVLFADGTPMRAYLTSDQKMRFFMPLGRMDPLLVRTTVLVEDRYFFYHFGVNPVSILRAAYQDLRAGRVVSGASTITMQIARMLSHRPRTLASKVIEAFQAMQLEARMSKRRLLEYYLNNAPYGGNIEGVYAASWFYFGKPPIHLSIAQIAFLVSLPKDPVARRPGGRNAGTGRNKILYKMYKYGLITHNNYLIALKKPIPSHKITPDSNNYHVAEILHARHGPGVVRAAIQPRIQGVVERIAAMHKQAILDDGANDLSIVVIENRTSRVRGLIGSIGFFHPGFGQFPVFLAPRSSGSTLKPFLFLLAIRKGLILPGSRLLDVPVDIRGYRPRNFYNRYKGLVRADIALAESRNLPFLDLLNRTGIDEFIRFLRKMGLPVPVYKDYGLGVIIGGLSVRLLDLTGMYATLARMGMAAKPLLTANETVRMHRVFGTAEAWLTIKALGMRGRPSAPRLRGLSPCHVYWKTGTSQGRRDAFSIGFTRRFTVGVWVGRVRGRGTRAITGAHTAAPIMFDVLEAIDPVDGPYARPKGLRTVQVCAFSGYKVTSACAQTVKALEPVDHPLNATCPFHRRFIVERKTGFRACPSRHYKPGALLSKNGLVLPPRLAEFLDMPARSAPVFGPDCPVASNPRAITIISPVTNKTYVLDPATPGLDVLSLQAETLTKSAVFWFVNGRFMGTTRSGAVLKLKPEPGLLRVLAIDGFGNQARVRVEVE